MNLYSFLL